MAELKLSIETDSPIGTTEAAEGILEVLASDSKWVPDRFGTYEPLRKKFQGDTESFLRDWSRAGTEGGRVATFLFAKKKVYEATAMWWPKGGQLSSVHFAFPVKSDDEAYARECLDFGLQLFEALKGQYGRLSTREEYWTKNVTDYWIGSTGQLEGGKAHGTDLNKHVPGIYWANYFGPAYIEFFGEERLRSAPAAEIRQAQRSCILVTAPSPFLWASKEVKEREQRIRGHLGAEAFFLLDDPDRLTRAPRFRVQSMYQEVAERAGGPD
jgi:hypothetical protein